MAAWTTPLLWALNRLVSPADLNTYLSDNTAHLYEQRIRSATGVTNLKIEHGSYLVTGANLANGATDVKALTFGQAFAAGTTIVLAECVHALRADATHWETHVFTGVHSITTTGCTILAYNAQGAELQNVTIAWLAIGPVA